MGTHLIVHLSSNQTGGAAIAARRLHAGLRALGTESRFVSATGTPNKDAGIDVLLKLYPRFWHNAAYRVGLPVRQHQKWQRRLQQINCELFASGLESDHDVLTQSSVQGASIVNLHWVPGMINWRTFFRSVNRPLVWTLHDMNPFLGIFHYTIDRDRSNAESRKLDQQVLEIKKQIFRSLEYPPVIVTPSKWLGQQSRDSQLFGEFHHEHIPNGIDCSIFKTYPQSFARSVFQLPVDRRLILVVAERLDDYRKGFDLLVDALNLMQVPNDVSLVAVGGGRVPVTSMPCHHLGSIHDERLMALLYSAADYTAITSRQDNLPNVILESLCCGTPVVGTQVGGIPEAIIMPRDGLVANECTADAIANSLHQGLETHFDRQTISTCAIERFDASVTTFAYQSLYESLGCE